MNRLPDRSRRWSRLPTPTAIPGPRSRVPKPTGGSVSHTPRACFSTKQQPAGHIPTQSASPSEPRPPKSPREAQDINSSLDNSASTTHIPSDLPKSTGLLPHVEPARSTNPKHKHSNSVDSGVGSSIGSEAEGGDAADTTPRALPLHVVSDTEPSSAPQLPPRSVPRVDSPTAGIAEASSKKTTMGHAHQLESSATMSDVTESTSSSNGNVSRTIDIRTPGSTASESPSNLKVIEDSSEQAPSQTHATLEVADISLRTLFGVALQTLEFPDIAINLTKAFIQELANVVKKDPNCVWALSQEPEDSPQAEGSHGDRPNRGNATGKVDHKSHPDRRPTKRSRERGSDEPGEDPDEGERRDKRPARGSDKGRADLAPADTTPYSCPFRKHSPTMFHVRDHAKCANRPWIGMTELKRHIMTDHYFIRFPCQRCGEGFPSREDQKAHILSPVACSPKTAPETMSNPKDGITYRMSQMFGSRKGDEKITTWDRLWTVLFGGVVPNTDFVPVVELEEVLAEFEDQLPRLVQSLNIYLKALLGEDVYEIFKTRADDVSVMVERWMRELFEDCRKIPLKNEDPSRPATAAGQQEAAKVDNIPISLSVNLEAADQGGLAGQSVAADEASNFSAQLDFAIDPYYLYPDDTSETALGNALDSGTYSVGQSVSAPESGGSTRQLGDYNFPRQQMFTQHTSAMQIGFNPDSRWHGNLIAPYNQPYHRPPLPSAPPAGPLPTPPPLAPQRHLQQRPHPSLDDPKAQLAFQRSALQQQAMRQKRQQQQPQQQRYPHGPSALEQFHKRSSGLGGPQPRSMAESKTDRGPRDSGVSDMSSLYSGRGSVWRLERAASPAFSLRDPSTPGGITTPEEIGGLQGSPGENGTFFNTDNE